MAFVVDPWLLQGIAPVMGIVNAGIGIYKYVRVRSGRPFSIPVWVFIYLQASILYMLYSVTFAPWIEHSAASPSFAGGAVLNTTIVYLILVDPAQVSQYVKGGRWWQRLRERQAAKAGTRQPRQG
jgi:hypothetical protein